MKSTGKGFEQHTQISAEVEGHNQLEDQQVRGSIMGRQGKISEQWSLHD